MNGSQFLTQLDTFFAKGETEKVAPFITEQLALAYQNKDDATCITILNEAIGFFRDLSQHEQSLTYANEALSLLTKLQLTDTLPYATTVLNVANALRAAGALEKSLVYHERALRIFKQLLPADDERIAAVYNNMSLLYQEMNDFDKAYTALLQALDIIKTKNDPMKLAITYSNLGSSLLNLRKVEEAFLYLVEARRLFEKEPTLDFHYSACMAALGQAHTVTGDLRVARECYRIALKEQYKHCGASDGYYRIMQNLNFVETQLGVEHTTTVDNQKASVHRKGLEIAKRFFLEVGLPALQEKLPQVIDIATFGLLGEGSECLGFDDAISTDHDFGPGFCIFLDRADYERYATDLTAIYEGLPKEFMGYKRLHVRGEQRVGVICMEDFFQRFLGAPTLEAWVTHMRQHLRNVDDSLFYNFFAGEIFMDKANKLGGLQEKVRQLLKNELSDYWLYKQIVSLRQLSQLGQCNFKRMYERQDELTAMLLKHKFIEECLKYMHIVNGVLAPYDKWLKKSAMQCKKLQQLIPQLILLSSETSYEKAVALIEGICTEIANELNGNNQYAFPDNVRHDNFLDSYGNTLLAFTKEEKEKWIDQLVALEWQAFDKVQNEEGRASCQDDHTTFFIMRKSQYRTWTVPMLMSFTQDFKEANANHWNLITEKYGRMMQSTAPQRYQALAPLLKERTAKQLEIVEAIIKIQIPWMEELVKAYPKLAQQTRLIHTYEDQPYDTSYETYLRGELLTYSEPTLLLYANFVVSLAKNNENLAEKTMMETAKLYGYSSLEELC